MAVRPCGIRSTGFAATTTTLVIGALFSIVAASPSTGASPPWDSEQTASVLVESGAVYDGSVIADDAAVSLATDGYGDIAEGSLATDESVPCDGESLCVACNGAGCDKCQRRAIFDLLVNHCHDKTGCWIGRVDALLLWRNAPPGGPLVTGDPLVPGSGLTAGGMNSTPAAGPRFSIFRFNNCTGHGIEATYLRAANFRSLRPLGELGVPYELASPPIYGNAGLTFASANADLGARVQSFEFNRHHRITQNVRFLAGFRWIEWQEQFSMQTYDATLAPQDYFQTNCFNDLYGGQIGLDGRLLATRWMRVDSVVKAGAYYNLGTQSSLYSAAGTTSEAYVASSPLSGAFAGEVGLTGVIPLTRCIDVRFGYFGLWLSGIAQPTRQLAGQVLPGPPTVATINANGGVILQGVSLGLEGRW